MNCAKYLDGFEYMQGLAYRDAIAFDDYEQRPEKEHDEEYYNEYNDEEPEESFLDNDPTYQAWIKERGAPPDCAAIWQETCADFFFQRICDGKCTTCKRLVELKGSLK
jgi:hypothetical protein